MDDRFVSESTRARELTEAGLRALWRERRPSVVLDVWEPEAPLGVMAEVRGSDGARIARMSAHASAANVLIGEDELLCSFDDGTVEQRVERVVGAVAALLTRHSGRPAG